MKTIYAILAFLTVTTITTTAFADVKTTVWKDSYGYTFDDDPLSAGGFGPNDTVIKVRAKAAKTTLIRPRISFVTELIKSVEYI
jgi:hypothetical protein